MVHLVRRVFFVVAALCLVLTSTRADRVVASGCPCTIWTPAATPAQCRGHRRTTDRGRREVPIRRRRLRDRRCASTKEHANVGVACRTPLVGDRRAAGRGDVHERDRGGLAGGRARAAGRDHGEHDLRRVVSRRLGLLRHRRRILRCSGRRFAAAARAAGRRRRPERRLSLRPERLPYRRSDEQLLGRRRACRPTSGPTRRRPPSLSVTPAANATGVPLATTVRADVQRGHRSGKPHIIHVRICATRPAPRSRRRSSYDAGTRTAILQRRPLDCWPKRRYIATLSGGAGGVKDLAGNALASDCRVVVHDRRGYAAGRRGSRRSDPRHLELVQPVRPLLRRNPARRRLERVHRRPTSRWSRPRCSPGMTSRFSARCR